MDNLARFTSIAPYLVNPLVLIGLGLFLFFEIHKLLLKANLLSPLSQRQSSTLLRLMVKHWAWVAVLMTVLGVAYAAFRANREAPTPITQQTGNCGASVAGDNNHTTIDCKNEATSK